MPKRRSRRLRKKLHIGEFQELGFEFDVQFKREPTPDEAESFVDALLAEAIESRNLAFGGWAQGGYVARAGRGSVTEQERDAVLDWLRSRPEVREVRASGLKDVWYGPFDDDDLVA